MKHPKLDDLKIFIKIFAKCWDTWDKSKRHPYEQSSIQFNYSGRFWIHGNRKFTRHNF